AVKKPPTPTPHIAPPPTRRDQVGDLVLAERVLVETQVNRKDVARTATLVEACNPRCFRAQHPSPPLQLRARVESEDAVAVPGRIMLWPIVRLISPLERRWAGGEGVVSRGLPTRGGPKGPRPAGEEPAGAG